MKEKSKYKYLVFLVALITPGGFIALGVLKAYEFYKKKQLEKSQKPKTFEEYMANLKAEVDKDPK